MPIKFHIQASGVFDGDEGESTTAPLPVFGIRGEVALTPSVFVRHHAELFYLEYSEFKGAITDVGVGLEWRPWKTVGIGLDLNSFTTRVRARGGDYPGIDFNGDIRLKAMGLMLYGSILH